MEEKGERKREKMEEKGGKRGEKRRGKRERRGGGAPRRCVAGHEPHRAAAPQPLVPIGSAAGRSGSGAGMAPCGSEPKRRSVQRSAAEDRSVASPPFRPAPPRTAGPNPARLRERRRSGPGSPSAARWRCGAGPAVRGCAGLCGAARLGSAPGRRGSERGCSARLGSARLQLGSDRFNSARIASVRFCTGTTGLGTGLHGPAPLGLHRLGTARC